MEFKGSANTLQDALTAAIRAAQKATPGADMLLKWKLGAVTGEVGGIAGMNIVTVIIDVSG